jgi:hypothetical protein
MNGREVAPAEVVRSISRGEAIAEMIDEAKARTWSFGWRTVGGCWSAAGEMGSRSWWGWRAKGGRSG